MSSGEKGTIPKAVRSPEFAIPAIPVFMVKHIKAISHFALIHWLPSKKKISNVLCTAPPWNCFQHPESSWCVGKTVKLTGGSALKPFLQAASLFLEVGIRVPVV